MTEPESTPSTTTQAQPQTAPQVKPKARAKAQAPASSKAGPQVKATVKAQRATKVKTPAKAKPPAKPERHCGACHGQVALKARYCRHCGMSLSVDVPANPFLPPPPKPWRPSRIPKRQHGLVVPMPKPEMAAATETSLARLTEQSPQSAPQNSPEPMPQVSTNPSATPSLGPSPSRMPSATPSGPLGIQLAVTLPGSDPVSRAPLERLHEPALKPQPQSQSQSQSRPAEPAFKISPRPPSPALKRAPPQVWDPLPELERRLSDLAQSHERIKPRLVRAEMSKRRVPKL